MTEKYRITYKDGYNTIQGVYDNPVNACKTMLERINIWRRNYGEGNYFRKLLDYAKMEKILVGERHDTLQTWGIWSGAFHSIYDLYKIIEQETK